MKTAVIMQPTYLPWMGYFDLMDQSDVFVLLDSVQFDRRSWQQRNRIKSPQGELMLTIPVIKKGKFSQRICDVNLDIFSGFFKNHIKAIEFNYRKAKFFDKYFDSIRGLLSKGEKLSEFTIEIMKWIKDSLGIKSELIRSSQLDVSGTKMELLVDICKKINADCYLSPLKSKEYIGNGNQFLSKNINLQYHQYAHPQYNQLFGEFIPYLSVLDLLFNEGDASLSIVRSGRESSISCV